MLIPGALPTQNLPSKSIETPKFKERRPLTVVKDTSIDITPDPSIYKNFADLSNRASKWKLKWNYEQFDDKIRFFHLETPYVIVKYEIIVDFTLEFTCIIFGTPLPDDHCLYKKNLRSVKNIRIQDLIDIITQSKLCEGTSVHEDIEPHVVPAKIDIDEPSTSKQSLKFFLITVLF